MMCLFYMFIEINPKKRYNARAFFRHSDLHQSIASHLNLSTIYLLCNQIMKLHSTNTQQYQTVTAYDDTGIDINAVRCEHSFYLMPELPLQAWDVTQFSDLTKAHFDALALLKPDVVILGTGLKQQFIHPKLITTLSEQHKGVECMDNAAACRTYNILMAEGRQVVLAVILDTTK